MHHCDKQKTTSVFLSFTYQCILPEKRLCENFIAKKDYIYVLNKFAICLPQIKEEIKYSFYVMTNVFFIYDCCLMKKYTRTIMKLKLGCNLCISTLASVFSGISCKYSKTNKSIQDNTTETYIEPL